jgi:hypothetical protein
MSFLEVSKANFYFSSTEENVLFILNNSICSKLHAFRAVFFLYLSAFGEYVLMAPSDDYCPFMNAMKEKTYIGKVTIDGL